MLSGCDYQSWNTVSKLKMDTMLTFCEPGNSKHLMWFLQKNTLKYTPIQDWHTLSVSQDYRQFQTWGVNIFVLNLNGFHMICLQNQLARWWRCVTILPVRTAFSSLKLFYLETQFSHTVTVLYTIAYLVFVMNLSPANLSTMHIARRVDDIHEHNGSFIRLLDNIWIYVWFQSCNVFLITLLVCKHTPHKVRTKESHLSRIGCGLASMHMYSEELMGLCKAKTQVRSIFVYKHSWHISCIWRDWAPI